MSTSSSNPVTPAGIAPTSIPVVVLSPEQSASDTIELRDASGNSRGLLVRNGGVTVFYSAERLAELQKRAANPGPVKSFREAFDNAMRRAREFHERQGNKS